jgi:hypothetical protein
MVYKQAWSIKNYRYVWDVSSAKILKKYSTNQNSTWTIEEVTYQRTNAPNLSSKDGLSKETKNREQGHGFELWSEDILGERVKWRVER